MGSGMLRLGNVKSFSFVVSTLSLVFVTVFSAKSPVPSNARQGKPFDGDHSASRITQYEILVWNFQKSLHVIFLYTSGENETAPFTSSSVRNCVLRTSNSEIFEAHPILFNMHTTVRPHTLPNFRKPGQYLVFFTHSSPVHTFHGVGKTSYGMSDYNALFNLSMTFRSDADVPVPYGRTVLLHRPPTGEDVGGLRNFSASKNKLVSEIASNCQGANERWMYIKALSRHITLDIYGACGRNVRPGYLKRDCNCTKGYKFYLAFENSNCREYITEKVWWNSSRRK